MKFAAPNRQLRHIEGVDSQTDSALGQKYRVRCRTDCRQHVSVDSPQRSGFGSALLVSSLRPGEFMKTLLAIAIGTVPLLATGVSYAQDGNMTNSGMGGAGWMGGYGGLWMPILVVVVIVVVGLAAWVVTRKGK